jgi:hypothetical protein
MRTIVVRLKKVGCMLALAIPVGAFQTGDPAQSLDLPQVLQTIQLPANWALVSGRNGTGELIHSKGLATGQSVSPDRVGSADAQLSIYVQNLAGHAAAVEQLPKAASEAEGKVSIKALGGWPSVSWSSHGPLRHPGEAGGGTPGQATMLKTVVALGADLVHFSTVVSPGAPKSLESDAQAIITGFIAKTGATLGPPDAKGAQDELNQVRRLLARRKQASSFALHAPSVVALAERTTLPAAIPGAPHAVLVTDGPGELEVAVSNDGKRVLVASNDHVSFSRNSGQSFQESRIDGWVVQPNGDPSTAVGASGRFFYSWMDGERQIRIAVSQDDLATFQSAGVAASCSATGCITDQPHIAADRSHLSSSGGDRLYVVWRDFKSDNVSPVSRITCSTDSGRTWLAQPVQIYDSSGDFPRLSVGGDGSVFVIFSAGQAIKLNKYGTCDGGLQLRTGFPTTVASFQTPVCPVPGLDRCNDGNLLSSATVAVDESNSSHIYAAWATSTAARKNEDIVAADSIDGGLTFRSFVTVNTAMRARRFMPWLIADGAVAYVNWYDRRFSTGRAGNDATRYFGALLKTASNGLVASAEADISKVNDRQCGDLWPRAPRSELDSRTCSAQPQSAGFCYGTRKRCDYKAPQCGGRECVVGEGEPKFGDYSGFAVKNGKRYSVWSSSTPPPGVAGQGQPGLKIYILVESMN